MLGRAVIEPFCSHIAQGDADKATIMRPDLRKIRLDGEKGRNARRVENEAWSANRFLGIVGRQQLDQGVSNVLVFSGKKTQVVVRLRWRR
jgi:hypothetical protein